MWGVWEGLQTRCHADGLLHAACTGLGKVPPVLAEQQVHMQGCADMGNFLLV